MRNDIRGDPSDWLNPELKWFIPLDPDDLMYKSETHEVFQHTTIDLNTRYVLNWKVFNLINNHYFKNLVIAGHQLVKDDLLKAALKYSSDEGKYYIEEMFFPNNNVSTKYSSILFDQFYPDNDNALMLKDNSPSEFYNELYKYSKDKKELSILNVYFRILAALEKDVPEIASVSMFVAEYTLYKKDLHTRIIMA